MSDTVFSEVDSKVVSFRACLLTLVGVGRGDPRRRDCALHRHPVVFLWSSDIVETRSDAKTATRSSFVEATIASFDYVL